MDYVPTQQGKPQATLIVAKRVKGSHMAPENTPGEPGDLALEPLPKSNNIIIIKQSFVD